MKAGAKDGLKDVLLEWLQHTQPNNILNDRHILCVRATEVAVALNIPGFKASNSWLHHSEQGHIIRHRKVCSESGVHGMIHSLKAKYITVLVQSTTADIKGKCKAVPLQAWSGPEDSRKLRFPDYMTTAQDGGKVVSPKHRPLLPPGNAPRTHFC